MSLRYRGAGLTAAQLAELGKVLIDASDTTAAFLSSKLLAGPGVALLVQSPGGNEDILVSTDGKLLIDAADTTRDFLSPKLLVTANLTKTIQNVGADENILLDVNLSTIEATLDGRYIKRSPSGENQKIQPLTNAIPLTLQAFTGASADILQVLDSSGAILGQINVTGDIVWSETVTIQPSAAVQVPFKIIPPLGTALDVFQMRDASGNIAFRASNNMAVKLANSLTTTTPLTILAQSGQSADILDIGNVGGSASAFSVGASSQLSITPNANVVPLTLREPSGGTVDILDALDSTGVKQVYIDNVGDLVVLKNFAAGGTPSSGVPVTINDAVLDTFTSSVNLILVNPTASFGAANLAYTAFNFSTVSGLNINGQSGETIKFVNALGRIRNTGAATTIALVQGIVGGANLAGDTVADTFSEVDALTATTLFGFAPTVTLYRALNVPAQGSSKVGTILGLDIAALTGTTIYGIREQSGGTNRLSGKTRIGDQTAPVQVLEATGSIPSIVLDGSEVSGTRLRLRENASAMEVTDDTPTVLRSIITRGAPNVTVTQNAVSVAVSFGSSEPDTNYEITVVPAYNTTVWYTLKATTGFTANFGTAGPVGGSTFDWHIERIPRT